MRLHDEHKIETYILGFDFNKDQPDKSILLVGTKEPGKFEDVSVVKSFEGSKVYDIYKILIED